MAVCAEKKLLRRKLYSLGAVALVIAICAATALFSGGEGEKADSDSAETSARRTFTVVLDAGHGGFDGGAVSNINGIPEAGLNLTVANAVKALLEEKGMNVIMTRTDENALGSDKRSDMKERKSVMNGDGVDAVVSVHMNKFKDRAVHGPMAFYMKGSAEGEKLATCVIEAVCAATGHNKRPANPGDYYMIRESPVPSVIIECGFLSNAEDEIKLCDPEHQSLLAKGIAEGVAAYLGNGS